MQHIYAFIFAGTFTALVAAVILYHDYGFWHERYIRDDSALMVKETVPMESPSKTLGSFWNDAFDRFHSIGTAGSFLEGKETYVKSETGTSAGSAE